MEWKRAARKLHSGAKMRKLDFGATWVGAWVRAARIVLRFPEPQNANIGKVGQIDCNWGMVSCKKDADASRKLHRAAV